MYGAYRELDSFVDATFGSPLGHSNYLVKKRLELCDSSENFVYVFIGILERDESCVLKVGYSKSYPFAYDETSGRRAKSYRIKEHMKDYKMIMTLDFFAGVSRSTEERFHSLCKLKYPHFCRDGILRDRNNARTKMLELYRPEFIFGVYSVLREVCSRDLGGVVFEDPAKNEVVRALGRPDWKKIVRDIVDSKKRKLSETGFSRRDFRVKRIKLL